MDCWICGDAATTGEHMTKRTDLELIFGRGVTQSSPLFMHNAKRKNAILQSLKADALKSPVKLCAKCNGALTQPYDNAWTTLITYLYTRTPPTKAGDIVRADRVFAQNATSHMLNVHLYFVKHMGDRLQQGIELGGDYTYDIDSLARPLRDRRASPNVYLKFGCGMAWHVGGSNLHTSIEERSRVLHSADWYYPLGGIVIQVIYAVPNYPHPALKGAWHPSQGTNRLVFSDFNKGMSSLPASGTEQIVTSKRIG